MTKPRLTALGGENASKAKDMRDFYRKTEIDVMARTLWGEARGEGDLGMQAVANVIQNRVKLAEEGRVIWWGHNIVQVCQKPYQFSCWNRTDPNFQKLQDVDAKDLYFATALRLARRAVAQCLSDVTGGATHYHADSVSPYWIRGEKPLKVIGNHIFYRIL